MEQSLDLILAKGNVITLNDQQSRVKAVGVEGEKIAQEKAGGEKGSEV